MEVEVRSLPPLHIAYLTIEGFAEGQFNEGISAGFDRVAAWVDAHGLWTQETLCVGVVYDLAEGAPGGARRYDAGFTVPAHVQAGSDGVAIQDLPQGEYAAVRVEVPNTGPEAMGLAIEKMAQAFDAILTDWLPTSPFRLDDRPCLELYLSAPDAASVIIDALVPITAKEK